MPRNVLRERTVRAHPDIVLAAVPLQPPAQFAESALQLPAFHGINVHTYVYDGNATRLGSSILESKRHGGTCKCTCQRHGRVASAPRWSTPSRWRTSPSPPRRLAPIISSTPVPASKRPTIGCSVRSRSSSRSFESRTPAWTDCLPSGGRITLRSNASRSWSCARREAGRRPKPRDGSWSPHSPSPRGRSVSTTKGRTCSFRCESPSAVSRNS